MIGDMILQSDHIKSPSSVSPEKERSQFKIGAIGIFWCLFTLGNFVGNELESVFE
jgi:hypothetical protein